MKQTINVNDFINAFRTYGRMDNFSVPGLKVLFEYLEGLEEDTGEEMELDVISLCCDYFEERIESVLKEREMENLDELRDHTTVLEVDEETIIYQAF